MQFAIGMQAEFKWGMETKAVAEAGSRAEDVCIRTQHHHGIYMFVCIYVCVCVCVYSHSLPLTHSHTHTHTHTHTHRSP